MYPFLLAFHNFKNQLIPICIGRVMAKILKPVQHMMGKLSYSLSISMVIHECVLLESYGSSWTFATLNGNTWTQKNPSKIKLPKLSTRENPLNFKLSKTMHQDNFSFFKLPISNFPSPFPLVLHHHESLFFFKFLCN